MGPGGGGTRIARVGNLKSVSNYSVDAFSMGFFPGAIEIPANLQVEILAHLRANLPEEACGLLGGRMLKDAEADTVVARTEIMLPIENALHSPVRFLMDPAAQLKSFYLLEERGLELVGIFHSHPTGPARPSPTDVAEFAYPGTLTLIYTPAAAAQGENSLTWSLRAFQIFTRTTSAGTSAIDNPTSRNLSGDKIVEVPIHIR